MITREAVFEARGVTKVYDVGEVEVHALRGVDVDLYQGEFAVLLGPSGSGKSTLLNILVPARSKVGAGDSMVAGITLGLARGHSLRDAVRFGIAAGAAAVMNDGTELCRREDAERLFEQVL
jgi:ABC-type lipoprotein export system ATPase subunit